MNCFRKRFLQTFRPKASLLVLLVLVFALYPALEPTHQSPERFENAPSLPVISTHYEGTDPVSAFWDWLQSSFHRTENFFQEYVGHVRPAWAAPQLYEYYNTGDNNYFSMHGTTWVAQTFTTSATVHTITSVKLLLYRTNSPHTMTVGIRATSGAHPTGNDLTSGTINADTFTTNTAGAWYQITVTEYTPSTNTKYAIVGRVPDSGVASVAWRCADSYTGGNFEDSGNSGASWTTYTAYDGMFEVWGNPLTVTITFALSGVSNDATGTIIAIDGTNYVYADFPKSFNWAIGSTKSVAATDPVSAGTGKQYDWTQWTNGDGLSTASGTYTVPGSAITVTAVYATQWYLTVTSTYGSPTGQGWYTSGSSGSSSVTSPASGGAGVQYLCTGWAGTGSAPASGSTANTGLFTMSAASSVTWSWVTQYQVTFTSSVIGADTTGTVVTVNGTAKTQAQLPYAIWVNATHHASYAFSSPVAASAGKQYLWLSTSGLSQTLQSNIFVVSGTGTVTGTYYIQWQISITQSGIAGDTGATTIVVVDSVNKAAGDLPFTAWYNDSVSISYTYTLNVVGSSFTYVWVSTSGCSQTLRSATFSATASGTLTGNYGVLGGTATVTTTVVQTTTTGTTATATTTTATTATATVTYTSVTVAVTLTSQTITSITISTSYTSLTLPPGLIPNQLNYNQAALGVDGLILVMNQTQVVYADVTIRFYGSGEFLIDNVEFQEPLGEVHWVTLNETMQGSCSCYKQVAGTDSVKLRVKLAPGLDIQPGVHVISMLVQGKTGDGLALGNTGWLAITVTSILPAQAALITSPTLTQAGAAVSAGVTLLVLIGTAMRRPKDSAGA